MLNNHDKLAKILWDFHLLNQKIIKSDLIWGLGCSRLEVAQKSSQLFLDGISPLILFTGGYGKITKDIFKQTEASTFRNIAISLGVPLEKILIEDQSTNTIESIGKAKELFAERKFDPQSIIIVTKPYMERRAFATFSLKFPNKTISVTSPDIKFEQYSKDQNDQIQNINLMVGDLQRIIEYANISLVPQVVPPAVLNAYEQLIALGYTNQLLSQEALFKTKNKV